MAKVNQRWQGINGDGNGRTIRYLVQEAGSDQLALAAVEAVAPLTYATFPRENMTVTEVKKPSVDGTGFPDPNVADGVYYVEVAYARNSTTRPPATTNKHPDPADNDTHHDSYAFEVSLETEQLVIPPQGTALKTDTQVGTNPNPAGGITYEYIDRQGIGYQGPGEGHAGGAIPMPIGSFSLTYYPDKSKVDVSVEQECVELVGKTSQAAFWGWGAYEVLCTSCAGQGRNTNDWQITFQFRAKKTKATLTIGNGIAFNSPRPWDYVDVEYVVAEVPTADGNVKTRHARQATLWPVYESVPDFNTTLSKLTTPPPPDP